MKVTQKVKLNDEIGIEVLEGVYKPSDDSYLILDLIEVTGQEKVLEIGCGSGIISLHCGAEGCYVLAVDKDERALENTRTNAKQNDIEIEIRRSDLFSKVDLERWDVIIFNPPYLPLEKGLPRDERWDGGERGDEVIERFLKSSKKYLAEEGNIYLCFSSLSKGDLKKKISTTGYEILDQKKKDFFFETIYAVKLKKPFDL